MAFQYSADTYVVNQTLVPRVKFCGENRQLLVAAKRYQQPIRQTMKTIATIFGLIILSFNSCQKKETEWTVIYGELNDNLAFNEVNGNYYYDNIEYFFINNKTKKCYRNLDTNQASLAKNLINDKLSELNKNNFDKKVFQDAIISSIKEEYINIEFTDKENRKVLYKINLVDTLNDNVFVYTKYKNNFLETMWTDRKSKTRRTKKLIKFESN